MKRTFAAISSVAIFLSADLSAKASLAIVNAGFEDPVTGTYTSGTTIIGWDAIVGSGGGVWNINDYPLTFWSASAPEGKQVGWLSGAPDGGPTSVDQTLGDLVVSGSTYTFSGSAGHPLGYGESQDPDTTYTVSILIGGLALASYTGTGPEASFELFSVSYTALLADAGKTLGIRLSTSHAQTAFDNLSMVPEPTTMIAGGLLLLPFAAGTLRVLRQRRTA